MQRRTMLGLAAALGLSRALPAAAWAATPAGQARPVPGTTNGVTAELITYLSHGKPIRAAVFRPGANARGSGMVFMHGSGGGIGLYPVQMAQHFAEDGYVAVIPTYLDAAADDIVRPEPVMDAWRDCGSDAIEWLIGQGIDRRRTGIMGYSLGSFIAVDGALGSTSQAGAAIALCGGWDVYIPRHPARRIPVLFIRAQRDTHVRPQSTERWREFLDDAEVPVRVEVIRGAGHLMNKTQWEEVYVRASTFFNGNIGRTP